MAKKKEVEKTVSTIKFADFVGRKLVDISSEEGVVKISFDNGFLISLTGNVHLSKERIENKEEDI